MKIFLTSILIGTLCFGTKLKIEESTFKEIAPGVASGYVLTKYEVQLKSTGGKKTTIEEVWLKNRKASWKLYDAEGNVVETISEKGVYSLKGETRKRSAGAKYKSNPGGDDIIGSYEEDFLVKYKIDGADDEKCLSIQKIEKIEQERMQ